MLTKKYITELKHKGNGDIANLVAAQRDVGSINFILENLGQLPNNFQADFLYNLLNHNHAQVRLNAVKNIGKLNEKPDTDSLSFFIKKKQIQELDVKSYRQLAGKENVQTNRCSIIF
ncbi:MAG: hypothetical protein LBQ39_00935 [Tannerellaceae bacterium]|jgi:hypothetical protein|nr:hypothetical protein [Tannerellaceae bacterium]